MKIKHVFLLFALLISTATVKSQECSNGNDSLIFERYAKYADPHIQLPIGRLMVKTAQFFLNEPYVANTLEQGKEHLVVNLHQLDCTTFVENCVALSLTMKSKDKSFNHYKAILQTLRYRNGKITDYASRLHYSSDWIFNNQQKGIWKDLTLKFGGTIQHKTIDFMSSHPQAYPALTKDLALQDKIKTCENILNGRKSFGLIPKEKIAEEAKNFKDGDILLFGTKLDGLDFSHMALIYRDKDVVTFIHASSAAQKVIVQPTSLVDYCMKSKNCNGIAIVRMDEPTN